MRGGWLGSLIVHMLIAAATLVAWPHGDDDLPPASDIVPIEVIDKISSVTSVSAIAPEPTEVDDTQDPTPEGAAQSAAPPTPPEVEAVQDPRQKQKVKQKDRPPSVSLNDISALIDRSKERGNNTPNSGGPTGPRPRERIGVGGDLTSSEPDAIASAIDSKWTNFSDFPNPERYWVTIRIQINANGTLAGEPQVVRTSLPISDPYMRVGVERSKRAIFAAEPLPVDPARTKRATFTMNFFLRD